MGHANCLRALIKLVQGLDDSEMSKLGVPNAIPLVYEFDADMVPIASELAVSPLRSGYYLGDAERISKVQASIRESIAYDAAEECQLPSVGDEDDDDGMPCAVIGDGTTCYEREGGGGLEWICEEPEANGVVRPTASTESEQQPAEATDNVA